MLEGLDVGVLDVDALKMTLEVVLIMTLDDIDVGDGVDWLEGLAEGEDVSPMVILKYAELCWSVESALLKSQKKKTGEFAS